ncbi:MAG: DUF2752 domain-containing protein [Blastocatellia bacterium]
MSTIDKLADLKIDEKILIWLVFVGFGTVLAISYFYQAPPNPKTSLCAFYNLTQLPCPGCGLTRSFCAIAKGQFIAAFNFHLLGPALFIATTLTWLSSLLALFATDKPIKFFYRLFTKDLSIKLFAVILATYWILRLSIVVINKI